ncbi:hypothetical protein [Devosia submarina]|uniref:hypothetical protein n=1 Tax=Devosia submarina TaxID=1173082 RepID=UPI00130081D1|nr:hypothetical protein [Devosia submarina]
MTNEIADDAIYIKGSKNTLLKTPVATKGGKSARIGVPDFYQVADRVGFEHIRRSNRLALGYAVSNVGFRDAASGSRTAG